MPARDPERRVAGIAPASTFPAHGPAAAAAGRAEALQHRRELAAALNTTLAYAAERCMARRQLIRLAPIARLA